MGTEAVDVLHTFDFGSIEEMDPSIGEATARSAAKVGARDGVCTIVRKNIDG